MYICIYTHTLTPSPIHTEAEVNAGLYVLAARDIFCLVGEPQFAHLRVFVSCFEIYGGKLFDLLNERGLVKCLEDAKQQVQLPGLTEHLVSDVPALLSLMALAHGARSTGSTGTYIQRVIYTYTYIHTHILIPIYSRIHTIYTYIHTYTHIYTHTCTHTLTNTH
jgi:hypothetical protein